MRPLPDPNPTAVGFLLSLSDRSKHGSPPRGWSSTIGIVTAICGNILISFALNTQRYAHLRLNRAHGEGRLEKKKAGRSDATPESSYGTQQMELSEERDRQNMRSESNLLHPTDADGAAETDPLIPRIHVRKPSASSEETARVDDTEESPSPKSYLRSPIWWLGISLMVAGEAGNFLAYGFAPASLVSPLGVVALISNCLIAPLLLGEHFRWRDAAGVAIATAGCVVVVLSANSHDPKLDADAIWELVKRWEFLTYVGITLVLIILLAFASNKIGHRSILVDLGLVALFGGYTALSTKGVASLLSNTIWRVVTFPITYVLLAVLVFTAIMQIKYLNRALQRFNATMVIPTQFVLFTLSVIIGSAILYRDFERQSGENAVKFVCGCALTFFGVWCITAGRSDTDVSEDYDGEGDAFNLDDEASTSNVDKREGVSSDKGTSSVTAKPESIAKTHVAGTDPESQTIPANASGELSLPSLADPNEPGTAKDALGAVSSQNAELDDQIQAAEESATSSNLVQLHDSVSEPVLPTLGTLPASPRPRTPLHETPSSLVADTPSRPPVTPRRASSSAGQHTDANGLYRLNHRHSVVDLLTGPLTSPLSGSLSAVVADERRRGFPVAGSATGSLRRQRSERLQARRSVPDAQLVQHAGPPSTPTPTRADVGLGPDYSGGARTPTKADSSRVRRLSTAFSDLVGSKTRNIRKTFSRPSANVERDRAARRPEPSNEGVRNERP